MDIRGDVARSYTQHSFTGGMEFGAEFWTSDLLSKWGLCDGDILQELVENGFDLAKINGVLAASVREAARGVSVASGGAKAGSLVLEADGTQEERAGAAG
ncbi:MAG: hypothetical protein GY944_26485 [bacterium]|nr:hypothetical protein [bacterium]